jgi:phytoene desaturase
MYRLHFPGFSADMSDDPAKMKTELSAKFGLDPAAYDRFMSREGRRFAKLLPFIRKHYSSFLSYLDPRFIPALPWAAFGRSMDQELRRYFQTDEQVLAFSFQSKYLGMSLWECPAFFNIIPFIEHGEGVHHVEGGLCRISETMAKLAEARGAIFHYGRSVQGIESEGGRFRSIVLSGGEKPSGDALVINPDFAWAAKNLFPAGSLRKYSKEAMDKKQYSCSTFMLYLGVEGNFDAPVHNIVFAKDYRRNVSDVFKDLKLTRSDISFYVHNASAVDPTLAPAGHSALYVLVPVPNRSAAGLDWAAEKAAYRELVLDEIEARSPFKSLRERIRCERIITPDEWQGECNVNLGAVFSIKHDWANMLHRRPHNRFEEMSGVYLAGGGTHPGSGLPTIWESARISCALLSKDLPL